MWISAIALSEKNITYCQKKKKSFNVDRWSDIHHLYYLLSYKRFFAKYDN